MAAPATMAADRMPAPPHPPHPHQPNLGPLHTAAAAAARLRGHEPPRTSQTHPINLSWILPDELLDANLDEAPSQAPQQASQHLQSSLQPGQNNKDSPPKLPSVPSMYSSTKTPGSTANVRSVEPSPGTSTSRRPAPAYISRFHSWLRTYLPDAYMSILHNSISSLATAGGSGFAMGSGGSGSGKRHWDEVNSRRGSNQAVTPEPGSGGPAPTHGARSGNSNNSNGGGKDSDSATLSHRNKTLHLSGPVGDVRAESRPAATVTAFSAGVSLHPAREEVERFEAGIVDADGILTSDTDANGGGGSGSAEHPVTRRTHGNFVLSSCPGKKVRLDTGPVNGRAMVCRDLASDFGRIAATGVRTVICCLNDIELKFLGSPWEEYAAAAHNNGISIIRIPIIEGAAPDSIQDVEHVLDQVEIRIANGDSVLCHCRGGIGRAGLIACCFLIRKGYCPTTDSAIRFVRKRRSPKAIETPAQEEFIAQYALWNRRMIANQ